MRGIKNNSNKCVILIILILVIVFGGYILFSLLNNDRNSKWQIEKGFRVDKQPLINRFEDLGNFTKCYWKANIIGKTNFGPSSYWMKGFVFLNNQDFMKFKEQYEWHDVEKGWRPSLDAEILEVQNFKWVYSDEFNNFIKPSNYVGNFYLDIINGIVFFDIQE